MENGARVYSSSLGLEPKRAELQPDQSAAVGGCPPGLRSTSTGAPRRGLRSRASGRPRPGPPRPRSDACRLFAGPSPDRRFPSLPRSSVERFSSWERPDWFLGRASRPGSPEGRPPADASLPRSPWPLRPPLRSLAGSPRPRSLRVRCSAESVGAMELLDSVPGGCPRAPWVRLSSASVEGWGFAVAGCALPVRSVEEPPVASTLSGLSPAVLLRPLPPRRPRLRRRLVASPLGPAGWASTPFFSLFGVGVDGGGRVEVSCTGARAGASLVATLSSRCNCKTSDGARPASARWLARSKRVSPAAREWSGCGLGGQARWPPMPGTGTPLVRVLRFQHSMQAEEVLESRAPRSRARACVLGGGPRRTIVRWGRPVFGPGRWAAGVVSYGPESIAEGKVEVAVVLSKKRHQVELGLPGEAGPMVSLHPAVEDLLLGSGEGGWIEGLVGLVGQSELEPLPLVDQPFHHIGRVVNRDVRPIVSEAEQIAPIVGALQSAVPGTNDGRMLHRLPVVPEVSERIEADATFDSGMESLGHESHRTADRASLLVSRRAALDFAAAPAGAFPPNGLPAHGSPVPGGRTLAAARVSGEWRLWRLRVGACGPAGYGAARRRRRSRARWAAARRMPLRP